MTQNCCNILALVTEHHCKSISPFFNAVQKHFIGGIVKLSQRSIVNAKTVRPQPQNNIHLKIQHSIKQIQWLFYNLIDKHKLCSFSIEIRPIQPTFLVNENTWPSGRNASLHINNRTVAHSSLSITVMLRS